MIIQAWQNSYCCVSFLSLSLSLLLFSLIYTTRQIIHQRMWNIPTNIENVIWLQILNLFDSISLGDINIQSHYDLSFASVSLSISLLYMWENHIRRKMETNNLVFVVVIWEHFPLPPPLMFLLLLLLLLVLLVWWCRYVTTLLARWWLWCFPLPLWLVKHLDIIIEYALG